MDRRRLEDWIPELGPVEEWLAHWAAQGWHPEYGYGVEITLGGRQVTRWALIYRPQAPAAEESR